MVAGDVSVDIVTPNARAGAFFDGVDDIVILKDLDVTTSFTISCWTKSISAALNQSIIASDNVSGSRSFNINTTASSDPNFLSAEFFSDNSYDGAVSFGIGLNQLNQWYNIILRYTSGKATKNIELFINGVLKGDILVADGTFFSGTDVLSIGARKVGAGHFNGFVGDVKFFNIALSNEEIVALAGDETINNGLLYHWPLISNYDDVVSGANGTNTGSILGIYEDDLAASIKAARTTANDVFLLANSANGRQVISTVIEEAP